MISNGRLVVISVVVSASAFIYWKLISKPVKKRKNHFIPGLVNSGNTCFVNSVLQCMSSLPAFTDWLQQASLFFHADEKVLFVNTLCDTMQLLQGGTNESYVDPSNILTDLIARGWYISFEEHDAHEFFHCLMTTCSDEVKYFIKQSLKPTTICNVSDHEIMFAEGVKDVPPFNTIKRLEAFTASKKLYKHAFHGLMSVRLRCACCGHNKPVIYEGFNNLSLSIDNCIGQTTLLDCIQSFFACEMLTDVQCDACTGKKKELAKVNTIESKSIPNTKSLLVSKSIHSPLTQLTLVDRFLKSKVLEHQSCGDDFMKEIVATSSFYKRTHISKFPRCLCIHLKRVTWRYGHPTKLYHHINYPEILNLDKFKYKYKSSPSLQTQPCLNPVFISLLQKSPCKLYVSSKYRSSYWKRINERNGVTRKHQIESFPDSHLYQLTGVIVHLGEWDHSGHFVAYRRHVLRDSRGNVSVQWFYTSDVTVRKACIQEVLNHSAYMLFYEKICSR